MACCTKKQSSSYHGGLNMPTRLIERIKPIRKLTMNLEVVGLLFEKFQTFCTFKHGLEVCEETQFKDLIGILGNFYIGTRIFNVVLQLSRKNEVQYASHQIRNNSIWSKNQLRDVQLADAEPRNYIVVEDYIIYMDMIYHGTDEEKDLISFMMIDEVGMGKITFPFYENFLLQFYSMYGELLQTNSIEQMKCHELALEVFQMIASVGLPEEEEVLSSRPKEEKTLLQSSGRQGSREDAIRTETSETNDQARLAHGSTKRIESKAIKFSEHLLKNGKKLTASEKKEFDDMKTLKEIEYMHNNPSGRGNRFSEEFDPFEFKTQTEGLIYFDFGDFQKFKKTFPEFLEWFENPGQHIEAILQADNEVSRHKIDWVTFREYHNEVMALMDETKTQMESLLSLMSGNNASAGHMETLNTQNSNLSMNRMKSEMTARRVAQKISATGKQKKSHFSRLPQTNRRQTVGGLRHPTIMQEEAQGDTSDPSGMEFDNLTRMSQNADNTRMTMVKVQSGVNLNNMTKFALDAIKMHNTNSQFGGANRRAQSQMRVPGPSLPNHNMHNLSQPARDTTVVEPTNLNIRSALKKAKSNVPEIQIEPKLTIVEEGSDEVTSKHSKSGDGPIPKVSAGILSLQQQLRGSGDTVKTSFKTSESSDYQVPIDHQAIKIKMDSSEVPQNRNNEARGKGQLAQPLSMEEEKKGGPSQVKLKDDLASFLLKGKSGVYDHFKDELPENEKDYRRGVSFYIEETERLDNALVKPEIALNIKKMLQTFEISREELTARFDGENKTLLENQKREGSLQRSGLSDTQRNSLAAGQEGKGGKFVRIEGAKFDIILNILIGIRRSLQNIIRLPGQQLTDYQFQKSVVSEGDWIDQDMQKNNTKGKVSKFKFVDYAPMVFGKLRERFHIPEDDYEASLGPEQILKSFLSNNFEMLYELCSSGQSGSLFYYTKNKKYMLKTIPKREFIKFRAVLKDYFMHMRDNPDSLICRFFGLHEVRFTDQSRKKQKMFIVIMNNVFKDFTVSEFFDLKGSKQGRNLLQPSDRIESRESKYGKTAMKDLDFLRFRKDTIVLNESDSEIRELLCKTATFREVVEKDCNFFARAGIIDYSLLLGKIDTKDSEGNSNLDQLIQLLEADPSLSHGVYFTQAQGDKPAEAYVIAIIDPLTGFTFKKTLEFRFKQCKHGMTMSCVPPRQYALRFKEFMWENIQSNEDLKEGST